MIGQSKLMIFQMEDKLITFNFFFENTNVRNIREALKAIDE